MRERVLLAFSIASTRSALHLMLEHEGFDVVEEVTSVSQLLAVLPVIRPQLLLMDWALPAFESSESVSDVIREARQHVTVVVLSGRIENRADALSAGAYGFVYLGNAPEELVRVLDRAVLKQPFS